MDPFLLLTIDKFWGFCSEARQKTENHCRQVTLCHSLWSPSQKTDSTSYLEVTMRIEGAVLAFLHEKGYLNLNTFPETYSFHLCL